MSEIMPIPPSPPLTRLHKVEREKERQNDGGKQQPKDDKSKQENNQPIQHIDEIV
ncbi:MAG: hypothetical protein PHH11_18675 [Methylomonas sp.]|nr:hypothetical protein [Methylomonas sp.]